MEVVNFYPEEFNNIPIQDNPAMADRVQECVMIVKKPKSTEATVLHIHPGPIETVMSIATFHSIEKALRYAKEYKVDECPICQSPLEDNGKCSDVGDNNCQYQA